MSRARPSARRWSVASRTLAATVGGYALVSLMTLVVPLLLGTIGVSRPQSWLATTMASFPIQAAIVMAVFHARTATRAWLGLLVAAVPLAVAVLLLF